MTPELVDRVANAIRDNIQAGLPEGVVVDYEYAARAALAAQQDGWQPIETAPKDHDIWACDPDKGYAARVRIVIANEAECIDFRGRRMGIGFFPKYWRELPHLGVEQAGE